MTESRQDVLWPDPRFALDLRAGEYEIRTDVVLGSETLQPHWLREHWSYGRLALLTLTNERLFFRPPAVSWGYRIDSYIGRLFLQRSLLPLTPLVYFELRDVVRAWTWQPEFSAPPALQIGTDLVYIDLHVDEPPWTQRASVDDIRAHLDAIRAVVASLREPRERTG